MLSSSSSKGQSSSSTTSSGDEASPADEFLFAQGERPNPADPKSRRPIQCVGVIPKLFECILAARITHALLRRGFFGDSQGAFLPLHGAETHVWTLVEVLRMRRNLGLDSYLLFVDFRNAYNEVHLGGLTAILRHVGFPPDLVELLQEWGDSRTTSARVNGSDSLPFATNRGVPQGSALSPILFIIFMVGLANRLARTPGLRGVTVPSRADNAAGAQGPGDVFRLLQLIYADDVAVTCDSGIRSRWPLKGSAGLPATLIARPFCANRIV